MALTLPTPTQLFEAILKDEPSIGDEELNDLLKAHKLYESFYFGAEYNIRFVPSRITDSALKYLNEFEFNTYEMQKSFSALLRICHKNHNGVRDYIVWYVEDEHAEFASEVLFRYRSLWKQ